MTWILIRSSGFVAYALLSMSVILGVSVAGGYMRRRLSPKTLTFAHESLSIGAIVSTVVHMLLLYADDFVVFEPSEILVPGQSDWRPVAITFGIVAFYGMLVISVSFYIRRMIGQKVWRGLHYASFGIWLSVLIHGLLAGTDRSTPIAWWLYGTSAVAVIVLVIARIVGEGSVVQSADRETARLS